MKTKNIINYLNLFLILAVLGSSLSAHSKTVSCLGHPLSLKKEYLGCLKNSKEAQSIRTNFDKILDRRKKCPTCVDAFSEESIFTSLYKLDYLMLTLDSHSFGGYSAHIVFKEKPTKIYRLWLYEIDEATFEIRELTALDSSPKAKKMMLKLIEKKYSKYWFKFSGRS